MSLIARIANLDRKFAWLLLGVVFATIFGAIAIYTGFIKRNAPDLESDPPAATGFFTIAPCRVLDTRPGSPLLNKVTRVIQVAGLCGVPSTAKAVAVNLTAVDPAGSGYITLWPGGMMPQVSAIHFQTARIRANNSIQPLAGDGSGTLLAQAFVTGGGHVHLLIDVVGYFE